MKNLIDSIIECSEMGGKILVCGNGGSASMSDHFVEELITIGLPAVSLCNSSIITALANDFSYSEVFSRQVKALGAMDDLLITFSTSGKSKNVLKAIETAKELGLKVIEMPRKGKSVGDIQERQLNLVHKVYENLKSMS